MKGEESVWYRLGQSLERARGSLDNLPIPAMQRDGRKGRKNRKPARKRERGDADLQTLLASGAGAAGIRILRRLVERRRPGLGSLVLAGAAGAGAALLREVVVAALAHDDEGVREELAEALLAGAGEGVLYGALLEPYLPDSSLLQGVAVGTAGYFTAPLGGLRGILRPLAPYGSVPVLGSLLSGEERERSLLEEVGYGVALAVLYRSMARRSGTRGEE